jgi:hypothetical protein
LLPERLTGIDETNRGTHYYLVEEDECLYFGEFYSWKGWSGGPTNQLIKNFKRTPSEIAGHASGSKFQYYKNQAIMEIAQGLRKQFSPDDVAQRYTFVPMPSSKLPGEADYCDRLHAALRQAFAFPPFRNPDIRRLVRQTKSVQADHLSGGARLGYDELLAITEIDGTQVEPPPRGEIVLFDDVLTSGKHYKVAKTRILEAFPDRKVTGLFVARTNHPNPADDFDDLGGP